ncbi:hypothetical protein ACHAXS_003439 [Conticribra weissflogii]
MFQQTPTSLSGSFSMNLQHQQQPQRAQQPRQQFSSFHNARKRTRPPSDPDAMDENNDDNSYSFSASSPDFFQDGFQAVSSSAAISPMNTSENYHENSFYNGGMDLYKNNSIDVSTPFQGHAPSLSQSSTTSTITFASVAATDSSSVRMDLSYHHDSKYGEEEDGFSEMTGGRGENDQDWGEAVAVVGSVICEGSSRSFGKNWNNEVCGGKSYIGRNEGERRRISGRPSKRAKASIFDEEMAPPSLVMTVEVSKSLGSLGLEGKGGLMSGKNNGLKGGGSEGCDGVCCHVCRSSSNSPADAEKCSVGKRNRLGNSHIGVGLAIGAAQSNATKAPKAKSQTLLTFFKPASQKNSMLSPKLHQSNLTSQLKYPAIPATHDSKCKKSDESFGLQPCRYCDKPTCTMCTRQCEQCERYFCTFCSKVDYADVVERILCFECDEVVLRSEERRDIGSGDDDVDMMDL